MPDNNAQDDNYDAEKEIMKINNIDIPKEEFEDGIDALYRITDNTFYENKGDKNEYRDYKQSNIDYAKNRLTAEIDKMRPCSILDGMNLDFIRREENQKLLSKIDRAFLNVF